MFQRSFLLLLALFASLTLAGWPSTTKKFYIGGNFRNVISSDNKTVQVNNVASFVLSSQSWSPLEDGFNAPVAAIYVDTFYTLYAGGSFNASGSTQTGPIARWKKSAWEAIAPVNTSWSANSVVNSISVDCYNVPSTYTNPDCDIYIGGSFNLTTNGQNALNVAWFDPTVKQWKRMGRADDIYAPKSTEIVNVVYKKGSAGVSDSKNFVWVGTNVGLYKYHTVEQTWKSPTDLGWTSGAVNSLYYDRNFISTDVIYLCGEFKFPCENGKTCTNAATYDYSKKKFKAIASSQPLTGAVSACQLGDDGYFYVVGSISYNPWKYFMRIKTSSMETASWDTIANIAVLVKSPVNSLDVCNSDVGCTEGSVAVVGNDGFGGFYNAKDSTYNTFGGGIEGDSRCITSTVKISTATPTHKVSAIVGVLLLLAALFFVL